MQDSNKEMVTRYKDSKQVGVVIPIYNVALYLRECLDTVINQTYRHLHIVLVNDGSTDESLEIAKAYARDDERIVIIDKANGGLSSARNAGIDYFAGKYEIDKNECENVSRASIIDYRGGVSA